MFKEEETCINNHKEEATVYKETTLPKNRKSLLSKIYYIFDLEILKNRLVVITIIGMSISFASELNLIVMIAFVLPELAKFTTADVALFISIQSIADVTGRLLIPLIGHYLNVSAKVMYCASLITSTMGRTGQ